MTIKSVNHYGKWVSSDKPVTGVLSCNSIAWECVDDEICLTCDKILDGIKAEYQDEGGDGDEFQDELDSIECDSSHTKIIGDWIKADDGKYSPDETKEFAAIVNESTVQVVWSKYTKRGALCSPCYPGQVDLDTPGDFLGYALPDELIYKEN